MYSFNVLADEIRNYTSILLSKLDERAKPNTSAIPQVKGACFICHRLSVQTGSSDPNIHQTSVSNAARTDTG